MWYLIKCSSQKIANLQILEAYSMRSFPNITYISISSYWLSEFKCIIIYIISIQELMSREVSISILHWECIARSHEILITSTSNFSQKIEECCKKKLLDNYRVWSLSNENYPITFIFNTNNCGPSTWYNQMW